MAALMAATASATRAGYTHTAAVVTSAHKTAAAAGRVKDHETAVTSGSMVTRQKPSGGSKVTRHQSGVKGHETAIVTV